VNNEIYKSPTEQAFEAFLQWKDQGRKVSSLLQSAGMTIPDELSRAISNNPADGDTSRRILIPAPKSPPRPPEAKDEWFWIKPSDASVRTLALAVLSDGKNWPVKDIIKRVRKYLPTQNAGSVYNVGAQLEGTLIKKNDDGWSLIGEEAPLFFEDYLWGPESVFREQDLASFRRMAVRYILEMNQDGLPLMQVFKQLNGVNWLRTPKSKDLIKADLKEMKKDGLARQLGSSKRWTVYDSKGQLMKGG
jgi:hypothetical protein